MTPWRGLSERIQRLNDLPDFSLERREVRVVTEPEISGLFCPGLGEFKQQIDGAREIPGSSLVLGDGRRRVTETNRPAAQGIGKHGRSHQPPVLLECRCRWDESGMQKSPVASPRNRTGTRLTSPAARFGPSDRLSLML
jgi:hypothetical protein